jgi:hypothetical protein
MYEEDPLFRSGMTTELFFTLSIWVGDPSPVTSAKVLVPDARDDSSFEENMGG